MNANRYTRYLNYKFVAVLSILFSTLAIEIAFQNPAQGYELSIYDSTSLIIWLNLILSIIGALFIVLYQISINKHISSNFWIIGVFILLFDRLILLYIPYIRGYFSWRGDNISHLGYLIDIITFGHTSSENYYPITHIFLAAVNVITGISTNMLCNYSTGIMSIFYVISIYLLATVTLHTKAEQILATTSVAVVFFTYNVFLMPNGWSQLYLPLLVFLYFKSFKKYNSFEYTVLFIILLVIYPFFHPLSSFYIIFMLISSGIFILIYFFLIEEKNSMKLINVTKKGTLTRQLISNFIKYFKALISISRFIGYNKQFFSLTAILIEIVIFISWILSFQIFHINIQILYNSILTGTSQDVIGGMQNSLNKVDISGISFIQLLIKLEGANLIFLGLFTVSLFILSKKRSDLQKNKNLLILSGTTIFTGLIYASYLFGIVPGLQTIGAVRIKSYLMLFTPISAGLVLTHLLQKKFIIKKVNIFPMLCMFIILTASMLSIFSLYPSPNTVSPNYEITQMDMKGTDWFLNYYNKEILTTSIMSPVFWFVDGIIGTVEEKKMLGSPYRHTNVPDHFNYTTMSKLGESYLDDRYMLVTKFDTVIYSTVWSTVGRFDSQDFDTLSRDTSVEKLYSNGETEIFFINAYK